MPGDNPIYPAGRSLSDTLATLPNLSNMIIKSEDQCRLAGAFGDVCKCQYDSGAGRMEVAVKSFRSPFALGENQNDNYVNKSANLQKMIRRELGIWRRLEHPNIVPFLGIAYGFGRQGQASLVSSWMPNGSLERFLRKYDDQLSTVHRLQLLLDIANGLCYLHSFSPTPIIHGDLSGNNVLLDHNYNARLTDFGYACMVGDIPEASHYLQMTTMRPGTLRYAAPDPFLADTEQATQPTTQSDIYSFGNLGLLVLSGKHPWSEIQRDAGVIVQLAKGKKPKRPSFRPIEDQHWDFIQYCWLSIGNRPAAMDVVSFLQRFLHSYQPLLPLVDTFHVSSQSSLSEQNTDRLKHGVQALRLSAVNSDHHRTTVFQDATIKSWNPENTQLTRPKHLTEDMLSPANSVGVPSRHEPEQSKPSYRIKAISRLKSYFHRRPSEAGLTEIQRLQGLLGERDEAIQIMKEERDNLEKGIGFLHATVRSQEQSSGHLDKVKEENWNHEVALQKFHALSETEHKRLNKLLEAARESADRYKNEAERTKTAFDEFKAKRDTEFAQAQEHVVGLQRNKSDLQSAHDALKAEMTRAHSSPLFRLHSAFREPDIQISDAALDSWKQDQLLDTETLLTAAIYESQNPSHHLLASRALVHARLQQWDKALGDAEMVSSALFSQVLTLTSSTKAIKAQPFVIGYIAKSIALVGKGEIHNGYRTCDIAVQHSHPSHVSFLLLIKAIIVFMAGEHIDAISRLDDLIATFPLNSIYCAAHMYLLLGKLQLEGSNSKSAVESFERASDQTRHRMDQPLFVVSLMCGWKFDNLHITIQQHLCEALIAAGRTRDAGESLLRTVNAIDKIEYMNGDIVKWVSDFAHRCLSTPKIDGGAARRDEAPELPATFSSPTPPPLLREWAKTTLMCGSWKHALFSAVGFIHPKASVYQVVCERLEATDSVTDALECFHEMMKELRKEVHTNRHMTEWVCEFTERHLSALEKDANAASRSAARHRNAPTFHVAPATLLGEWAQAKLALDSWKAALLSAVRFTVPRGTIYQTLCERLESIHCVTDAVECFHQMASELGGDGNLYGDHAGWTLDFRARSFEELERLGDTAVDAHRHDDAIAHYSTALSLNPSSPQGVLIKRSKTHAAAGSWEQALDDADRVIALDSSSPWGYEIKHAALYQAGDYDNAVDAFEEMFSKIMQSPDPEVRQHSDQYIDPSKTRATIRKIIQRSIHHSPRILIDTTTGRLYHKAEQASVFESSPVFKELVSSMTTRMDTTRIKREVQQYFRYVMLSHKWEDNEPLFQQVIHVAVYDLDKSPTHDKLQMFCKIVRDAGFKWAWSDTCCIDKSDHIVLQEALVAMFRWYQGAAMMIVFLRGVRPSSPCGALAASIWNTRAWTLQEYIAAKVIRFYTEDWTLYRDLEVPNHKESPEVISEMELATGVSAQQLMELCPGLSNIREKLCLASTRRTTRVEDAAYSLLGIFSVIGIPAIYGEGEASLGRLLANVLTRSGDLSILAWTGESSRFNSCLPAHITVFKGTAAKHLPRPIQDSEMEYIITELRTPSFDLDVALRLYDRLNELPTPRFAESRMTLPCIAFQLPSLLCYRARSGRVYRVETEAFGMVEIKTRHALSQENLLYLVHPWLDTLLEREDMQSGAPVEVDTSPPPSPKTDDEETFDGDVDCDASSLLELESPTLYASQSMSEPVDRETRARRLIARLKQPFGALLLAPALTGRRAMSYRRVAADSLITVRFQENVTLADLLDNVRTLDVL